MYGAESAENSDFIFSNRFELPFSFACDATEQRYVRVMTSFFKKEKVPLVPKEVSRKRSRNGGSGKSRKLAIDFEISHFVQWACKCFLAAIE